MLGRATRIQIQGNDGIFAIDPSSAIVRQMEKTLLPEVDDGTDSPPLL